MNTLRKQILRLLRLLIDEPKSARGVYVWVRVKFDEHTFRIADPQTTRVLDTAGTAGRP